MDASRNLKEEDAIKYFVFFYRIIIYVHRVEKQEINHSNIHIIQRLPEFRNDDLEILLKLFFRCNLGNLYILFFINLQAFLILYIFPFCSVKVRTKVKIIKTIEKIMIFLYILKDDLNIKTLRLFSSISSNQKSYHPLKYFLIVLLKFNYYNLKYFFNNEIINKNTIIQLNIQPYKCHFSFTNELIIY